VAATAKRLGVRVPTGAAGDLPALLHEHGLLILEDSQLDDDALVALARTLGEPARVGSFRTPTGVFSRLAA
jgi:hypothetical protein